MLYQEKTPLIKEKCDLENLLCVNYMRFLTCRNI